MSRDERVAHNRPARTDAVLDTTALAPLWKAARRPRYGELDNLRFVVDDGGCCGEGGAVDGAGDDVGRTGSAYASARTATGVVAVEVANDVNHAPVIRVPHAIHISRDGDGHAVECMDASGVTYDPVADAALPPSPWATCGARIAIAHPLEALEDTPRAIEGVSVDDPDLDVVWGALIEVRIHAAAGAVALPAALEQNLGLDWLPDVAAALGGGGGADSSRGGAAGALAFRAGLADANRALASLAYVGARDWHGVDNVTIVVDDLGFSGVGGAMRDAVTLPLRVAPVNDPPSIALAPFEGVAGASFAADGGGATWATAHTLGDPADASLLSVAARGFAVDEDSKLRLSVAVADADFARAPRVLDAQGFGRTGQVYGDDATATLRVTVSAAHGALMLCAAGCRGLAFATPSAASETARAGNFVSYETTSSGQPLPRDDVSVGADGASGASGAALGAGAGAGEPPQLWWRWAQFVGRLDDVNRALADLTYWPDRNFNSDGAAALFGDGGTIGAVGGGSELDVLEFSVEDLGAPPPAAASQRWAYAPDDGGVFAEEAAAATDAPARAAAHPMRSRVRAYVRVRAANDAPTLTVPGEQLAHADGVAATTADGLSLAVRGVDRMFADEDTDLAIGPISIHDVEARRREAGATARPSVTVTLEARHGTVRLSTARDARGAGVGLVAPTYEDGDALGAMHGAEADVNAARSVGPDGGAPHRFANPDALSGLVFLEGDGVDDTRMTFRATLDDANALLANGVTFRGARDYHGPHAALVVTVRDDGGYGVTSPGGAVARPPPHAFHALRDDAPFGDAAADDAAAPPFAYGDFGLADRRRIPITVRPVNDAPLLGLPAGAYLGGSGVELYRSLGTPPARDAGYWDDAAAPRFVDPAATHGAADAKKGGAAWRASLLRDIASGPDSSSPRHFTEYDGLLYFQASEPDHGAELWRTDGTETGTVLFSDLLPGRRGAAPAWLAVFGDHLYFSAAGVDTTWALARTPRVDACGSFRRSAFAPSVRFLVAAPDTAARGWETTRTYDCPVGYHWATTAEGEALFSGVHGDGYGALGADGYDLGAPAGGAGSSTRDGEATPVDGAERGAASGTPEPKTYWGECGWDGYAWGGVTRTHFRFADSHSTGAYKHAGKRDSFRLDYDAPRGGAVPRAEFGGAVCVEDAVGGGADGGVALREHADDPCRAGHDHQPECRTDAGAELWRTDGTKAGTTRVDDLRGGALGAQPKYLTPFAGALYFQANTDGEGAELWRSDGKRGGARLVEDIYRGGRGSAPRYLTPCGASLYFAADDGRYGDELWASDGSLGHLGDDDTRVAPGFQTSGGRGTHLVHDVRAGRDGGAPKHLACLPASAQSGASARDVLFFAADDGGAHGEELWAVKAGRRGGATLVRDVRPGRRGSSPRYMTAFGSRVFFQADDGTHGAELWASDGTHGGTALLRDVRAGTGSGAPSFLTPLAAASFFGGAHDRAGRLDGPYGDGRDALYFVASDGRLAGGAHAASRAHDVGAGADAAREHSDAVGLGGRQLWVTDGTPAGTRRAFDQTPNDADVDAGALDAAWPPRLGTLNGALFYAARHDDAHNLGPAGALRAVANPDAAFLEQFAVLGDVDSGRDGRDDPLQLTLRVVAGGGELDDGSGAGGTLTLGDARGLAFAAGCDGLDDTLIVANGSAADLNAALRNVTYHAAGSTAALGWHAIEVEVRDFAAPCGSTANATAAARAAAGARARASGLEDLGVDGANATEALDNAPAACAFGGHGDARGRVRVFVSAVNEAPTLEVAAGPHVARAWDGSAADAWLAITGGPGGFAARADDPDAGETTWVDAYGARRTPPMRAELSVARGVLALATREGLGITIGDGRRDRRVAFDAPLAELNAALASLQYRCAPEDGCGAAEAGGDDAITVRVSDNGFTGAGGALVAEATIPITVVSAAAAAAAA